jgi:hypothetical protein
MESVHFERLVPTHQPKTSRHNSQAHNIILHRYGILMSHIHERCLILFTYAMPSSRRRRGGGWRGVSQYSNRPIKADWSYFSFGQIQRFLSWQLHSHQQCGSIQHPIECSLWVKRPESEADHLLLFKAQVKRIPSFPPYFYGVLFNYAQ